MTDVHDCPVSSVLPEYLRRSMAHKSFNKMQAECLATWESDVNMLISAPTGAGKTVCFELAILRVLHNAMGTSEQKRLGSKGLDGKMVYIAPTKSLCSERARDWQRKFEDLGLRVQAITGDVGLTSLGSTLRNTDLVVATAEKWDSLTRNLGSKSPSELSTQIRLLLLDEVHQVGDARGAAFEAVVTRMLIARDTSATQMSSGGRALPAAALRVIAVSATVTNATDIGRWLRVSEDNVKVFDDTYRPVSLEYHVLGYSARNPWVFGKVYDSHILQVVTKYGEGKPCIVFCTSRKQTVTSAQTILDKLNREGSELKRQVNPFTRSLSEEQISRLALCAEQCNHPLLRRLLPSGIAIHNADLNARTRNLVETLFRESLIGCLFSTSTLAQGVNLPARLVVMAGTTVYNDGCLQEYQKNLLLQMCGRAGRPGLDSKGVVVIMTALSRVAAYQGMAEKSSSILKSQLSSSIAECVNAEVARQVITDVPSTVIFLSSTLFWTQSRSSFIEEIDISNPNKITGLHSVAVKAINTLCDSKLVQYDADRFGLSCTLAGLFMARYCLSVDTMRFLLTSIPTAGSPSQILRMVASCPEMHESIRLRRLERKRLNQMNEWVRMPVKGKVQDTTDKIVVLLQIMMGDQKNSCSSDVALRSEAQRLLQPAARISACIIAMVLHSAISAQYETAIAVLHLCRGIQNRCLWDGPTVLRQVPGISVSDMRALNRAGIFSLAKLSQQTPEALHGKLGCRSAFATTIDERMRLFPRFVVKTEVLRGKGTDGKILSISARVEISSMRGNNKPRQRRGASCFILIGTHSHGLLARHIFPLSEGCGSINCSVPGDVDQTTHRWIDIVVGCDNICGTDVTKRIWNWKEQQVGQPDHLQGTARGVQRANHRLSVTEGRVTKKPSQTILRGKENSLPTSSTAQRLPPRKRDQKSQVSPLPDSTFRINTKPRLDESCSIQQKKGLAIPEKPSNTPTPTPVKDELENKFKGQKKNAEHKFLRKQKQTPARSESHIALSHAPLQANGKEYDEVFRALF